MWYVYAIFFLYVWSWYSIVNIGNVCVLYDGYNVYALQHKSIDVNILVCFRVFTGGDTLRVTVVVYVQRSTCLHQVTRRVITYTFPSMGGIFSGDTQIQFILRKVYYVNIYSKHTPCM